MEDDDYDELMAWLGEFKRRCDAAMAERASAILAAIDEAPPLDIGDDDVVLLGLEGQVDHVWRVPGPLPAVLLAPIFERISLVRVDEEWRPPRSARYDRIGERLYQRAP